MKGDIKMNGIKCIENYIDVNKKLRKAVIFGAITAGATAGAYVGIKKIILMVLENP